MTFFRRKTDLDDKHLKITNVKLILTKLVFDITIDSNTTTDLLSKALTNEFLESLNRKELSLYEDYETQIRRELKAMPKEWHARRQHLLDFLNAYQAPTTDTIEMRNKEAIALFKSIGRRMGTSAPNGIDQEIEALLARLERLTAKDTKAAIKNEAEKYFNGFS